ncbi:DUF6174 domain-containing protein [Aulosira sp. FACHB-615]|uniref:DUF6174 domain-containing protein n=1 Tax=Aulosira sp. FACHB-615 TaxID=2692777 RepID=UPI001683A008|nr:DUF6174 domain-containing protein [Aulosira sp. FACHB-615]MBD2489561.1 hypothetical protein [Aulosira sp. FACHB-615]
MRLPITIGAILVASLSFNAPVFSASPVQVVQTLPNSNLKQLIINEKLWNRQDIKNYRYTVTNNCFCAPEFRGPSIIEVRNGITVSITNAATGQAVNPSLLKPYSTVPRLFNLIRNAIRESSELTVTYNPQRGYPTQINIGNLAADAGIFTTISNFEKLR